MTAYLIAIGVFVLLCGAWALFQWWTGYQADGTGVDDDSRSCHGCGGVENSEKHR